MAKKPYGNIYQRNTNVSIKATDIYNIYPVGSIYLSVVDTDPSVYFGGTWERIKDEFLLLAGDTYTAGSVGGKSSTTIIQANLPDRVMVRTAKNNVNACFCNAYGSGWCNMTLYDANLEHSRPMDIMPPYLTVYGWKRIS